MRKLGVRTPRTGVLERLRTGSVSDRVMNLSEAERGLLVSLTRRQSVKSVYPRRAKLILMLEDGESRKTIMSRLDCDSRFITRWSGRFLAERLAGMYARHPGRAPKQPVAKLEGRVLSHTLKRKPAGGSTHWSSRKLAAELGDVSFSTVQRIWHKHGVRPHRLDQRLKSNDPDLETKATDVIGLYLNPPAHAAVFSVDEKTAIQALDREDRMPPLPPGRAESHGFDYKRNGTLSLFAALNTATEEVLGKTAPRHTSDQFAAFLTDMTIDGKGVPMRPAMGEPMPARDRGTKGPRPNSKREARVAAVYSIAPFVRTPVDILGEIGEKNGPKAVGPKRPRPQDKRVWASLKKSKDEMFVELAEEMLKRDPQRKRTWVCVTDGDPALQYRALAALGAGGEVILVLDIFHVTEYLWEAGRAFHGEGTKATREWVGYYLEKILYGEASQAVRGMRQSATKRRMRGAKRKAVDRAAKYILRNQAFMKYGEYLAAGIPIGSGVAEGTCRHLVKDRMERTGTRWTMRCAEAVLKMRAIEICGATKEYWDFHIEREQARLRGGTKWQIAA